MCGRSKAPQALLYLPPIGGRFLFALCLVLCFSCARTPEQQVARSLEDALETLYEGDVDEYMQTLDFGAPLDSAHYALYSEAVRQQLLQEGHEQKVTSWHVSEVKFQNDTLATAFYTLYLASGDSLCKGQKMAKTDGVWKMRMKD